MSLGERRARSVADRLWGAASEESLAIARVGHSVGDPPLPLYISLLPPSLNDPRRIIINLIQVGARVSPPPWRQICYHRISHPLVRLEESNRKWRWAWPRRMFLPWKPPQR